MNSVKSDTKLDRVSNRAACMFTAGRRGGRKDSETSRNTRRRSPSPLWTTLDGDATQKLSLCSARLTLQLDFDDDWGAIEVEDNIRSAGDLLTRSRSGVDSTLSDKGSKRAQNSY